MAFSIGFILCAISAVLFIVTMSLEATAKAGDVNQADSPDVVAGLGLTANILGFLVAALGCLLTFTSNTAKHLKLLFTVFGIIVFWFQGSATGAWALIVDLTTFDSLYDIWAASMAFEVITSFFWLLTLIFMVADPMSVTEK